MKYGRLGDQLQTVMRQTTDMTIKSLSEVRFWLVIASLTMLCFWSGPFGTIDTLPDGLRFVYWALIVILTGLVGVWAHALIRVQGWQGVVSITVIGAVFGVCVTGIVTLISIALLNPIQRYPGPLELFFYSFPSATVVFLISVFLEQSKEAPHQSKATIRPVLFQRLKTYQAAEFILALRAQDHYVEVITEQGSELCLVRLNDAISEASPTKGVQIHRSHWVSISTIKRLEKQGSEQFVCIANGTKLKVSQSRVKELRQVLSQVF